MGIKATGICNSIKICKYRDARFCRFDGDCPYKETDKDKFVITNIRNIEFVPIK